MKKIKTSIVFVLACLIMFGCSSDSDEKRIESAMKQYVKTNYANPNDYKGIISITPIDTIDVVTVARKLINDTDKVDSMFMARMDYMNDALKKAKEAIDDPNKWYLHSLLQEDRQKLIDCQLYILYSDMLESDSIYCAKIDSLLSAVKFDPMRRFIVKVKTIQNGSLEYVDKSYEAHVTDAKAVIANGKNDYDCYSNKQDEYMLLLNLTTKLAEQRTNKLKATEKGVDFAEMIITLLDRNSDL